MNWIAPITIAFITIIIDILVGIIKGIYLHKLKSSIMRKGLWHKLAEAILLITSLIIAFLTDKFWQDLPINLINLYMSCAGYIIIMEIISIIENLHEINPKISLKYLIDETDPNGKHSK